VSWGDASPVSTGAGSSGAASSGSAPISTVPIEAASISTVSISFEDFDYSLGAVTPAPKVILAIGLGEPGSAFATFLSIDTSPLACLQQWQLDGQPFTFAIDQRGPYFGLLCDRAAGNVYYVLRTATPTEVPGTATTLVAGETTTSLKPVVSIATTAQQIDHDGPVVTLTDLGGETFPDDGTAKRKYGDIQGCDHPPLFP
jgi:hypothetical protein